MGSGRCASDECGSSSNRGKAPRRNCLARMAATSTNKKRLRIGSAFGRGSRGASGSATCSTTSTVSMDKETSTRARGPAQECDLPASRRDQGRSTASPSAPVPWSAFRFGLGLLAGARPFRKALSAFFGLHRIEKRSGRLASGHRRLALFEKVLHRGFCDFAHGVTREGVEHS